MSEFNLGTGRDPFRKSRSSQLAGLVLVLLSFSVFSAPAQAFTPDSDYVLRQWLEQTRSVKTLQIRRNTKLFDSSFPGGQVELQETVWIKRPFQFRREISYPRGKINQVMGSKAAVEITPEKTKLKGPVEVLGSIGILYTYQDLNRLKVVLRQAEIDLNETAWVLDDGTVSIRIGKATENHLLFVKDSWIPLKIRFGNQVHFFDITQPYRFGFPFPDRFEIQKNGKIIEDSLTREVNSGISLSDQVFKIELLQGFKLPE